MTTPRRKILQGMGGMAALASAGCAPIAGAGPTVRRSDTRPNVLFIMTDDHSQSALSCYGSTILKTPNLDRIAAGGARFNQAFVTNSLCLPSRATYLTGLYSHAHGMVTNGEESGFMHEPILDNRITYPNMLRGAGYHTGVVGKWHVNTPPQGYDYTAVLPGQGQYFDPEMIVQGRMTRGQGHTDDVIAEQAMGFLNDRPRDRPFCLLYQFKAPHGPWDPPERFKTAFNDITLPEPATLLEDMVDRPRALRAAQMSVAGMGNYRNRGVPADLPADERARRTYQLFVKDYYRVLLGVDENVGKVLDLLDREGLSENTLIVYTSDNGFFLGHHGLFDKRLMYEPSIKVPFLVRHPASIAPGQVNDAQMVLNTDVAPSFLDFAGLAADPHMHGRSFRSIVQGSTPADWRTDFLYQYFEFPAAHCVRPHRGVRDDRYKLIEWQTVGEYELYDLRADPDEMVNLAGRPEHAELETRLKDRLMALRQAVGDTDRPGYRIGDPDLRHCPALPDA